MADVVCLGQIDLVTFYANGLPTSKLQPVARLIHQQGQQVDKPIIRLAGWMPGFMIADLLDYTGCRIQLVGTVKGGKFEAFLRSANPDADHWLNQKQVDRMFDSLRRQNVGVVSAFSNPQGLNLVLAPIGSRTPGLATRLSLEIDDDDQLVLMAPTSEIQLAMAS